MTCTEIDVSSLVDHEQDFERPCDASDERGCLQVAEWSVWTGHGGMCVEATAYLCAQCKGVCEGAWLDAIAHGRLCRCGHPLTGQLSDNFRAIRL